MFDLSREESEGNDRILQEGGEHVDFCREWRGGGKINLFKEEGAARDMMNYPGVGAMIK